MHLIVIDDDKAMCDLVEAALAGPETAVTAFTRPSEGLAFIRANPVDVVLTDARMPEMSGISLCSEVQRSKPALPVIVLTGFGSMETAVDAMRAGAYDFLSKPVSLEELEFTVRRASQLHGLKKELSRLRSEVHRPGGLIGTSRPFRRLLEQVPKAARTDVPILIQGETGTGKELLARAIHEAGPRAAGPFVPVNCSAIPGTLVESELFGHVRGAFTDASSTRTGLFVQARGGTLFLDEVGELPPDVQPKLLRVLQEHRLRPVGADTEVEVQCRVVAATNRDLKAASEEGTFRSDLYFRLAVIRLVTPPLRDRAGDILELAQHFIRRAAARTGIETYGLSTNAARALMAYSWPGNVRELENAMERAIAMTDTDELQPSDLPDDVFEPMAPSTTAPGLVSLAELERAHIQRVLEATGGNKKAAAEILGLDRRTLYRKLARETEQGR